MSGMYELRLVFEQVVDGLNDIPLSEHHFIIKGHEPVLHVGLNSMYKLYTVIKQGVKQLWRNVSSVRKDFPIQFLGQDFPHFWIPVVNISSCKTECYDFSPVITQKVKLESVAPAHCALAIGSHTLEHLVGIAP